MVVPDSTQQLLAAEREALAKAEKERDIALRDADRPAACLMLARCVKKGLGYELGKMKERAEKAEKERDGLRAENVRLGACKQDYDMMVAYSLGRKRYIEGERVNAYGTEDPRWQSFQNGMDEESEGDELREKVKALREALLKAEWEGPLTYSDGRGCPVCHQGKPRRHTEQCKLSLALAATAKERP